MRIIHVTDTHLVGPGNLLFTLDPTQRLEVVLRKIEAEFSDADLCVISGDLTDGGEPEAYRTLRDRLDNFPVPTRLLIGNHDNRENFRRAFPETPIDDNGFIQSFDDLEGTRLIYLDTPEPGAPQGRLCDKRLGWLKSTLEGAAGKSVVIFTHYPFLSIGLPTFRNILLSNPRDVMPLLHAHGGVRHIFCGHAHVAMAGQWEGIPFTISAGTCHHIVPDLASPDLRFIALTPQFDVATITTEMIHVHRIEAQDPPVLAVMPGV
ncbi:phosphodiesterase [Mesorhizobium sp. BH1-1-4]|uniref:phosphodiesterase n=1 Tax=Mesorhizobium sp. BH1-1-4 TaxID=2876662 RepID=UPI001CD087AE|nr:phosphodiesterase [Mesorhizobium sp. BH1-1-4]MBZ9994288.1 phosphodiesterase [Mesorhizobium sp. BH1-1-4]